MSSRYLILTAMAILAACALMSGCTRPIVKPPFGLDRMPSSFLPEAAPTAGPIGTSNIQALQATLKPVYFDFDQYTLSPESQQALQYDAEILKRAPNVPIVAEGHCDERGTEEYNLALGDRRARSAINYLQELGVPSQSLSAVSYGSELPVDPGHNEAAWAKNRRVYLRVSK
jgi:peptidoglycan-associated lipoprotein